MVVLSANDKESWYCTLSPKEQKFNSYCDAKADLIPSILSCNSFVLVWPTEAELSTAITKIGFSTVEETDFIKGESKRNEISETTKDLTQNRTIFKVEGSSVSFEFLQ